MVTSAVERSNPGSSSARRAKSRLVFPVPGSPMNAHTGPGRSVRLRALRKLNTRISLSSGSGVIEDGKLTSLAMSDPGWTNFDEGYVSAHDWSAALGGGAPLPVEEAT